MSAILHPSTTSTPTISSSASDSEIIEQLKRQLGATEQRLQYAELKICVLEERLRQQRIAKYGPGSEKLCDEQLELLELERDGFAQAFAADVDAAEARIMAAVQKPLSISSFAGKSSPLPSTRKKSWAACTRRNLAASALRGNRSHAGLHLAG